LSQILTNFSLNCFWFEFFSYYREEISSTDIDPSRPAASLQLFL
jgi:hypothetical protein